MVALSQRLYQTVLADRSHDNLSIPGTVGIDITHFLLTISSDMKEFLKKESSAQFSVI